VDGTNWFNNATPLVIIPVNGSVNATINVRLNSAVTGNYSGNIVHVTPGTASVGIAVSGTTAPPPSVTVTGALNAFTQTVGTPSAVQTYTVSGANLTGNITITPPVNYQVSSNGGTTWFTNASPLVLAPTSGTLANTTISVRLNATAAGSYSGNITNTTQGATTVNVAVTGTTVPQPAITVTGSLSNFSQPLGTPSAVKTYTVSGANLTGNMVITAPTGYELSTDGATWSINPITLTQTSGTIATTTISVRLNANAAGSYTGNISHASTGATAVNVAVSGTTVLPPSVTIAQSLTQFLQIIFSPSSLQTYTVSGSNLTGNVTITPPHRYELSLNGNSWQTTPVTLAPANGTLASTTISIRLNGVVTGAYNGNLAHATPGFATVNIPLKGFVTINRQYSIYPVPARHTAFMVHPQMPEPAVLSIYTIAGQKIKTMYTVPNSFETPIDISNFRQGIYIIELNTGTEKTVLRLLKQ
jgi:hypothetical protein